MSVAFHPSEQAAAKSFIDRATARCLQHQGLAALLSTGQITSASLPRSASQPRTPPSSWPRQGSPAAVSAAANQQQSLDMMMATFEKHVLQLNSRFDEQAAQILHMEQNAFRAWKTKFDKQRVQIGRRFDKQEAQIQALTMRLAEISNSRDATAANQTSQLLTASDSNPLAIGIA